jgi:hypothetical protein
MNRDALVTKLADHIAGKRSHPLGVAGFMIEDQIALGRAVVQPGSIWPFDFPKADWVFPTVVSHDGREVFIVAILAQEPGNGAFRRLIGNIRGAGLTPVVVCPVGAIMPAILKRWGWVERIVGNGWEAVDEWRPPSESRADDAPEGCAQGDSGRTP